MVRWLHGRSRAFAACVLIVPVLGVAGALALRASLLATAQSVERSEFFAACSLGTPEQVQVFLDRGWSPNEREQLYDPNVSVLKVLSKLFTSQRREEDDGRTVAFAALENKAHRLQVLTLLLDRGADVNAKAPYSLLSSAVSQGDVRSVTLLFERGAKLKPTGTEELRIALWKPNPKMIKLLLSKGARAPTSWERGLHRSVSKAKREEIRKILAGTVP